MNFISLGAGARCEWVYPSVKLRLGGMWRSQGGTDGSLPQASRLSCKLVRAGDWG